MTDLSLPERALLFATNAHRSQRRKHSGAPYVFHTVDVAKGLADSGVRDEEVLAAGLLHDVVEDTAVTVEELGKEFGTRVAGFVAELTYRADRNTKEGYLAGFATASAEALAIKLVDRRCNVRDYTVDQPEYAPAYAGKAMMLFDAVDSRMGDLTETFGPECATRLATLSALLRDVASGRA